MCLWITPHRDWSDVLFTIRLELGVFGRKITDIRCHFHHLSGTYCPRDSSPWLWTSVPCWGGVRRLPTVKLTGFASVHTAVMGRKSLKWGGVMFSLLEGVVSLLVIWNCAWEIYLFSPFSVVTGAL